jgi:hypothetical protein
MVRPVEVRPRARPLREESSPRANLSHNVMKGKSTASSDDTCVGTSSPGAESEGDGSHGAREDLHQVICDGLRGDHPDSWPKYAGQTVEVRSSRTPASGPLSAVVMKRDCIETIEAALRHPGRLATVPRAEC